ncbi:MAG: hypothetical protein DRP11_00210, partial [Candidatus Aenigmatarchaeota archaeon]
FAEIRKALDEGMQEQNEKMAELATLFSELKRRIAALEERVEAIDLPDERLDEFRQSITKHLNEMIDEYEKRFDMIRESINKNTVSAEEAKNIARMKTEELESKVNVRFQEIESSLNDVRNKLLEIEGNAVTRGWADEHQSLEKEMFQELKGRIDSLDASISDRINSLMEEAKLKLKEDFTLLEKRVEDSIKGVEDALLRDMKRNEMDIEKLRKRIRDSNEELRKKIEREVKSAKESLIRNMDKEFRDIDSKLEKLDLLERVFVSYLKQLEKFKEGREGLVIKRALKKLGG